MHYASHILIYYIAFCYAINTGNAARSSISPEILANFAKNVASVLSPVILGDLQTRNNRSSQSVLTIPTNSQPEDDKPDSFSILDNVVDITSNPTYESYSGSYAYDRAYENSHEDYERAETTEGREREESYLRQERPDFYNRFYRPYDFSPDNENRKVSQESTDVDSHQPSSNIEESSSNRYSTYQNAGFNKALAQEPYGGFHGFGPYGHFHGYQPYGYHHGGGNAPPSEGEVAPGENANNGTNRQGYGPPYLGNHDYLQPYSPFPYGGHSQFNSYYGPNQNDSATNGRDGQPYGYGPYHGGHDFYGPPDYGYNHGYGYNNNNNNNEQTGETAQNGDQNNSTKNGYTHPYGVPLTKPLLGTFHPHGFPFPFNFLPHDHFHGAFKTGPVAAVGHAGYPIYADPYLTGFPFHPYGTFFNGKNNKYLPPKDSDDKGEKTESPAGELTQNEDPGRLTAPNTDQIAPAPSSNRYKTSKRKELKRVSLINFENGRI